MSVFLWGLLFLMGHIWGKHCYRELLSNILKTTYFKHFPCFLYTCKPTISPFAGIQTISTACQTKLWTNCRFLSVLNFASVSAHTVSFHNPIAYIILLLKTCMHLHNKLLDIPWYIHIYSHLICSCSIHFPIWISKSIIYNFI